MPGSVKPDQKQGRDERRRGAIRTALILGAVVFAIYLFFVGRGIFNYFMT